MTTTYFQGYNIHPYHISVGGVVVNDESKVLVHYFNEDPQVGYYKNNNLIDFYILMRETVEPNETLELALERGLKEEMRVVGELQTYLGSLQTHFDHKGVEIEKTTLYFLVKLISQEEHIKVAEDATSELQWHDIDFLIPKMQEQTKRFGRTDFDESEILTRVKETI